MTNIDIGVLVGFVVCLCIIIFKFWIPPRGHVFLRQMCRGFRPLFTEYTTIWTFPSDREELFYTLDDSKKIKIPNLFIITLYIVACVFSIKWLS